MCLFRILPIQIAIWEDTLSGFVSMSSEVSELSKAIESLTKIVNQQIGNLLILRQMFIEKSVFHENCAPLEILGVVRTFNDEDKGLKELIFV